MNGKLRQQTQSPAGPARARSHGEELAARLDAVEAWLAQRRPRSEIIELAGAQWGISVRQADRYLAQAAARWREQLEPEREACRRRNLATVDTGIAEAFRQSKLRDVAVLVRLRAMLDGSLNAQPVPSSLPSPAVEEPPPSLPGLVRSISDLVMVESSAGEMSSELRQELKELLASCETALRTGPAQLGAER
jgi:hypothetical protein